MTDRLLFLSSAEIDESEFLPFRLERKRPLAAEDVLKELGEKERALRFGERQLVLLQEKKVKKKTETKQCHFP